MKNLHWKLTMRALKIFGSVFVVLFVVAALLLYQGEIPKDVVDAKYTSSSSKFLEKPNGSRVHYRDEGNPAGRAIVLVHGSNASLHTWEPWVELLGDEYRVVTLDLPGHGLTGGVPDQDYSSEAQIRTVKAVADALELDTFVLGGNSMGGGVTWRYALEYPEQVEAMLLIDASGLPAWWEARRQLQAEDDKDSPLAFKLLSQPWFRAFARHIDPYHLVVQGVETSYNYSPVINQALIDRYYELSLREGTRDATLARFSARWDTSVTYDLSQLTMPALIMWGREDSLIPVETADQFHEALPDSEVVIYDNVGHIPMEEIPERSAADVRSFLSANL